MEETREAVCKDLRSCDRSSLRPNYLYMIETRQHIHQSHRRSSAPQSGTQVSTTGWFIHTRKLVCVGGSVQQPERERQRIQQESLYRKEGAGLWRRRGGSEGCVYPAGPLLRPRLRSGRCLQTTAPRTESRCSGRRPCSRCRL